MATQDKKDILSFTARLMLTLVLGAYLIVTMIPAHEYGHCVGYVIEGSKEHCNVTYTNPLSTEDSDNAAGRAWVPRDVIDNREHNWEHLHHAWIIPITAIPIYIILAIVSWWAAQPMIQLRARRHNKTQRQHTKTTKKSSA